MQDDNQEAVRVGRKRVYESDAARLAAHRERHNKRQLNVDIAFDAWEALDAYYKRQVADGPGRTKAQVIEHLIRSQIMRKR